MSCPKHAIRSRQLLVLYPGTAFLSPEQLLATDPDSQRACGFSAAKLATMRGIAQAVVDGIVPHRADRALDIGLWRLGICGDCPPDDEIHSQESEFLRMKSGLFWAL
ncbi:MAG: hypothetical protein KGM95_03865 [Betaproteobacteria bacterium]|nr:hypothetical protein [Betaproteobacteria bacterium]